MSDDKKQKEERERQEKEERERYMPTTSISGGMSIPLGGGIGLNISTGRPTISIGPGLSMDI